MNFFSQPCLALSDSPKLSAKQGHAKSTTFAPILHSRVSAFRERGSLTPSSLNPLTPRYCVAAFTLIELMAATTVLSVILLMMVGMQDQMAKAWSNSNRRTDATREARAAVQTISSDLSGLLTRQRTNMDGYVGSIAVTNMGLPFVYSSNGVNSSGLTLPSGIQPGASFLFGVCTKKPRVPTDLDLMIFGYYIGQTNTTNINGFTTTNYNLYRYVVPTTNTVAALNGVTTGNLNTLFPNIAADSEILARNTCNLRIRFYNSQNAGMPVTNGPNYRVFSACTSNNYSGSKIHIELSAYPEDSAQKIPLTAWTNSANIQKYARSFEFRIDVPRTITH